MLESYSQLMALDEKVSVSQLKQLEKYLDGLFKDLDLDVEFSKHFIERVNDVRNKDEPITISQLRDVFRQNYRENKDKLKSLSDKDDAHFLKVANRLNIPFTITKDKKGNLDLVAKTVVRRRPEWVKRGKPQDGAPLLKVD